MGDLVRSGDSRVKAIMAQDTQFQIRGLMITLAEKTNQCEAISLKVDQLKTVEVPKLELHRDALRVEVDEIKEHIRELQRSLDPDGTIDADFTVQSE